MVSVLSHLYVRSWVVGYPLLLSQFRLSFISSIFSSRLRKGMYCARKAGKCIFIGSVCIEIADVSPWVCVLVILLSSLADVQNIEMCLGL